MLKYKLYQDTREGSKTEGKWFARVAVGETVDLDGLAKHMADHNSPYSAGLITGILKDMVACIRELTLDGKAVKIPDLAIFSIGLKTEGANSAKEFNAAKNVVGVKMRSRATGVFTRQQLKLAAQVREQDDYSSPDADGQGSEGGNQGTEGGGN